MSASAWVRIEPVLDQALAMTPPERARWLDQLATTDPALHAAVKPYLAALEERPGFLERSVAGVAPELVAASLDVLPEVPADPPRSIGPYRIIRELGHGGMGTVFLAERADGQYQRSVAIKIVRGVGPRDASRFQREREILASLDHPGIARLLDGGTTPEGLGFLVMEHVDGEPIDQYADRHRLSIEARVALFDQVAAAVEFAHQRLVVHRDVKPTNVLVTATGQAKLLDFGIAKLLDGDADVTATRTGAVVATLPFASPEQLRGEPVTVASDVYALGVLGYQLLTGRSPYRMAEAATVPQWLAAVLEQTPDRPSAAAPAAWRSRLMGDLDAILLTALAKEPERRYPSVSHLRDDLRRYRAALPVTARPPSLRYLATKFAARNKVLVASVVVAGIAIVGGVSAAVWQARVATRQASRAEQVTEFVTSIFEQADPDRAGSRRVTAEQLLDRAQTRLTSDPGGGTPMRAELMGVVGTLYRRLGNLDSARATLTRAVALDSSGTADPLDRASRLAALANVEHELSNYQAAESLSMAALALRRRHLAAGHPLVLASMGDVGVVRSQLGDFEAADSMIGPALALARRAGDSAALGEALGDAGQLAWRRSRHADAIPLLQEAVALHRQRLGEGHTRTATDLQRLAAVFTDMGAFDSAAALLNETVAVRERLLGPDHYLVASALGELAELYQRQGRRDLAAEPAARALAIRRRTLGDQHHDVALSYNQVAVLDYSRARYAEAVEGFVKALAIWRPLLGDDHPTVLSGLNNLGSTYRQAGQLEESERALAEVLAIRIRVLGPEHQDVAQSRNNLALLHQLRGKDREAEAGFIAAAAGWRAALGDRHPTVAFALASHGRFLSERGRCREGEPILREAVELREAALDSLSADLAVARREWAICLGELGEPGRAMALLERVLPVARRAWGTESPGTKRAEVALAELKRLGPRR